MNKIVLAFDGSTHAINAVNEAKKLMQGFPGVSLTILEVLEIAKAKDQALDLSKNYEERKNVRIDEVKQQLVGILDIFEVSILIGDPASEIIQHVKQNDYDLLIMGSRGLNLLQEFVMGSVSHKVMKYVPIPVLIVK
ncbi:universal stress protein [Carnobacterium maltaromaticum]|uniref:universal stress protein n=1 Tax=Carnobacterium maltaromaticum TaxID=2751 RepID=UPI00165AD6AA|nr:universal stress protein [Carnobacterium maltaromaticum]MBC9787284.1 universal stress protein [Carnobacterium maltaromaticum]